MNKKEEAIVIRSSDESGDFVWLSEAAENRLGWILAAVMFLAVSPVFAVMLLM